MQRRMIAPEGAALANARARVKSGRFERLLGSLFSGTARRERELLSKESERGFEELTVQASTVVLHEEPAGGPFLFVDDGTGLILFLGGQWIYDPTIVPNSTLDPPDHWCRDFRLVRSAATGIVLLFEKLSDDAIKPEQWLSCPIPYLGESCLFAGTASDLEQRLRTIVVPVSRPEPDALWRQRDRADGENREGGGAGCDG
jgi:hypothetical protein